MSRNNLEDIYPLAPMQQGILFQTLFASEASEPGAYFVQTGWTLRGDVDTKALVRAFQEVTARHGALRTAFVWEKLERPMQVVWKRVKIPVTEVDLRGLAPAEQAARVAAFLEEDRRRGFDLTRAPLMRLAFLRLDEDAYRFVWSSHHLILDGWSNPILLFEAFGLYSAQANGRELRLERARPYGDYIAWLQKQDASKAQAFWRARLAGLTAPTPIPIGSASAALSGPVRHGERKREIAGPVLASIQELVRRHGLTASTLLQGAWALLLSRYSGEDDVLFGATVSGRAAPVPGIDRMVGLFINTVPVRVRVPSGATVLTWLQALQQAQGEVSEFEHSPLVDVQGWSAIPRGTPLFESLVVFENYPIDPVASPQQDAAKGAAGPQKRTAITDGATSETPPYPLTVLAALRKTLVLQIGHDARRFDTATVDRILEHLASVLEQLATSPQAKLGDLTLLSAEERRTVLVGFNDTAKSYPDGALIHELFEAQVDAVPEAIALVFEGRELTYGELERRSNQLARALRSRGVGPDVLVGVCLERSFELLIALYAVLKAGGAYVPLDPDYPSDRLAFMLDDAKPSVLLTAGRLERLLPPHAAEVICLDVGWSAIEKELNSRLDRGALGLSNLAYVIYTSGSTGRPKGAMNEHGGVLNRLQWMQDAHGLTRGDRVLQKTPFSFDVSVWELFWPLMFGARLVIARPDGHRDPAYLAAIVQEQGITTTHFVPSMLAVFLAEPAAAACRSLVRVFASGEALLPAVVDTFYARLGGSELHNLYGPTEAAVDVTAEVCAPGCAFVPIGRPIANVHIYLLDERREPSPIGVPGELYIGGVQVGRGYLNRAELTAERFISSPFVAGERLYRTGDVARWSSEGSVEYLGRVDHQVKIRGFRIELGEIEAALAEQAGVREVVVVAREEKPGDKRLVAYLAATEGATLTVSALRDALGRRLPAYMVPSAFVILPALPLTASGKIDRRALPAPGSSRGEVVHVPPRGPVEETIAGVFAEVLAATDVGAHESFFDLGGHSLLATQAVTRIRAALGVELPLRALFDSPTPAELARLVSGSLRAERAVGEIPRPALVAVPRDHKLRLSFAQERLWLVDQIDPGNPAYNVPDPLRLVGPLDVPAFERALDEVVRRHEVLRTTFATADGRPVQIIHAEVPFRGALVDLSALPAAEREPKARAIVAEEARLPFDLARGPLLRARLIRLDAEQHVLALTMHHIVSDAWTRGIMSREIRALYEAFRVGEASPLPELAVQYADYAEWQRGWLAGDVLAQQLGYWKQNLAGAPLALELPTDRPRPPVQTFRGGLRGMVLAPEATKALHDLSRKEGLTLYMTLLTALSLLLYRYTGQPDVLVGTSIAGRTHAETEKLVGFFINALVLRTVVDDDETLRALLQQVRTTCLGAYAHQDMPFERLVHELSPEPDRSRAPLFQVIFTMQNAPRAGLALPGLEIRSLGGGGSTTAKYDLTFLMGDIEGRLNFSIEFNADLFDATTVERMLRQLSTLLVAMPKALEKKVREIGILPDDERARLLTAWNPAAAAAPEDACLHDLFEAQVDRTPDALALVAGGSRLTYAELDRRANQLAHHLRTLGVGAESVVGLCLGRGAEIIVGLLGILKAGGAYVPLEPGYPAARIAQILGEAGAKIVVTQAALAASMPAFVQAILVDAEAARLAAELSERLETETSSSNLAYVLFTSGSTGKPKGVAVEHRQLVNYTLGVGERLGLPAGASYAHVSTFAADLGNTVLFPPLVTGGVLHVIAEELTTDPDALGAYFAREGIDCLKIVPSHLAALLAAAQPGRVLPRTLLVLGGEASRWELIDRLARLAPSLRVLNHYGPTETTVGVLTYAVTSGDRPATAIVPLGKPLPNNRVHVLDARMEPTPTGVPGEVYIGGAQVARGYLDQPELTRERFVADPFTPGARLYKTGDRARYLPDGNLVFLGRVDFQVKIRGFRIELGEVEAALAAHPGVQEAVVLALDDGDTKRLAAFVVKASGAEAPSSEALAAFVAERLPEAMVPASITLLDALPLSSNGKIDRRALATIETPREVAGEYAAPRTPTEEVLASIWADVFARPRVGTDERFSDLGGHSLLAIQIVARAREAFQAEIPLRTIFEHPTIGALAATVDALVREGEGLEAPPITRMPRSAALRLSFAQERLWFLDQLEPGSSFYNVPSATHFAGPFDVAAMTRAFAEVVRRHEVLRTTFTLDNGQPMQVIHDVVASPLPVVDLGALAPAAREDAARAAMRDEAARPFDLEAGPMVRGQLVRLGESDHVLLLTLHHIVSDASTRVIFQRELMALYAAFAKGLPSPLAELPIQYADYAHWQRTWLDGEVLEKQLAYWKSHLLGAPTALVLPTDRGRPPVQTHRGERRSVTLPASLLGALKELSRREGMTLFMTLLGAAYALLHRYSGQDDILVGTPILNRSRRETEGLIGFFVNTLVLRARPAGELPFRELLQQVREACLGGYAHQDIPFERLVQELAPDRDLSRSPLFQVMFTLETVGGEGASGGSGLKMRGMSAPTTTAKFDLMIGMVEAPSGLGVNIEYNVDLFDGATIDRMLRHLRALLESFSADADQTIRGAKMLSDDERRQILVEWNDTRIEYPREATLHSLVEGHAAARPDSLALSFGGESITYRELSRRANQLAHHLRARGVELDQPVGLLAVRSIEMIVGVLGILKAGGAYLPLDPDYPAPRLAFMIEAAGARIVVGTGRFPAALEGLPLVRLDADREAIARESEAPLVDVGASGSTLAYVMFTSGSTGTPKAVGIEHRSVVHLVRWTNYATFDADEVFLQLAPMTFDAATFEMWAPLLNGGRLAIFAPGIPSLPDLAEAIRAEGITTLFLTSGLFNAMIESHVEGLATLRRVFTGGDALSVSHVQTALAALPNVEIVNAYGPTEGTVFATSYSVPRGPTSGAMPIGRPVANTQVYILDEAGEPVPVGVFGELHVGGDGVGRGYLNRPELTAERFVPSPFAANERLYKTGDLARWLPDGAIAFGGRRDFQVKIRGFRVELGEIEAVLGRHPALRECTVIAREDTPGNKRLVAYLVALPDATAPTTTEARAFLKETLPDHLIPTAFVVLAEMPRTAHSKIDRAALPAPDEGANRNPQGTVAPRDELEAQIINVWRSVLGVSRIGIRDSFFDLGGHSMLAVKMTAELKKAIGRTIPLMSLFEAQTIEQIADLLRDGAAKLEWKTLVPMKATGTRRPFFLVTRPNANSLGYIALAKRLDPDQPVYGLQFQYPEESYLGRPYTRDEYEERGRSYVGILRAFQPEGPYLLGGMCEGALIAFVMTRQLEAAGQKVAFLGMMDAWPEENTRDPFLNWAYRKYDTIRGFVRMSRPKKQQFAQRLIARLTARVRPKRRGEQVSEAHNDVVQKAAFAATTQALWDQRTFPGPGFVAPQVDAPITVFRVKEQPGWRIRDEKLGWSNRTRAGVTLHHVDGVHTDFMRPPHVVVLARELTVALRKAHAGIAREEAAAAEPVQPAKAPAR
jgi:amino acid adenylation domain-containing protein